MLFRRATKRQKTAVRLFLVATLLTLGIFSYQNYKNNSSALAEVDPDDWSLSLGFCDSETDNGSTMLTDQDWILTDDNPTPKTRIYTLQINYSANDLDRDYAPGELQLKIYFPAADNPSSTSVFRKLTLTNDLGMPWTDSGFLVAYNTTVAAKKANVASTVDYDWQYSCSEETYLCTFTNLKTIEKNSSLQGSIQASMKLALNGGSNGAPLFRELNVEELQYNTTATLNDTISSNPINIKFRTEKAVNWTKRYYTITTTPLKLDSYDGINVENRQDYTWVHYYYYGINAYRPDSVSGNKYEDPYYEGIDPGNYSYAQGSKYIPLKDWHWEDDFSSDALVLDANGQQMTRDPDTGKYVVSDSKARSLDNCKVTLGTSTYTQETCSEIFVGFPKDKFNEALGTNYVSNTAYSKGTFFLEDEEVELSQSSGQVNLSDFELEYNGNAVGITKKDAFDRLYKPVEIKYQHFKTNAGATITYDINAKATEVGDEPYTLIIGDDLTYFQDMSTGEFTRISDNDYNFTKILAPYTITGANGEAFDCEAHAVEVLYRRKGQSEYESLNLYGNNAHPCGKWLSGSSWQSPTWNLPSDTVAWKIIIPNASQAILDYDLTTVVNYHSNSAPQHGKVYNFSYIEIQRNDQTLNSPTLENYSEGPARNIIAPYDYETYGHYQQRSFGETEYTGREYTPTVTSMSGNLYLPNTTTMSYDAETDTFKGRLYNSVVISQRVTDGEKDPEIILDDLTENDLVTSFTQYSLLPAGTYITSTPGEFANSFNSEYYYYSKIVPYLFNLEGEQVFSSGTEFNQYIRSHSHISIINNWRNSGQQLVRIYIDFSEKPFFAHNSQMSIFGYYYPNYSVPYDVYAENEAIQQGYEYYFKSITMNDDSIVNDPENSAYLHPTYDDGSYFGDPIFADVDEDGSTSDRTSNSSGHFSILNAVSAEQSIKESVQTDQTNSFTTDDSYASIGSEYEHKLAVRTGNNKAVNVVIYDNIETSYGDNEHWQGEFIGIDTTFANAITDANGKAIRVKTYYSPNSDAGSLTTDNSWQEYVEGTTDKSTVKSIAFKYLDEDGNSAVIPANSYIYTLIRMKAPTDNGTTSFAYNSFRSEWNAINQGSDQPIEQIEGISSNTTRVQLDHLFDIHVVKVWNDYNNKYNTRPSSINPKLYRDIELVDGQSTINIAGGDSTLDFHGMHEYYDGQYDVELAAIQCPAANNTTVECYTTEKSYDADTHTYTFTSTLNTTNITVKKVWEDYNDAYGLRPENVDFTLKYGSDEIDTKNLTITGNQDQFNFSDIPTHLVDSHDVTLTPFSENYTTRLEKSDDGLTYTFTSTLNVEPITVIHRWENDSDVINSRPGNVSFNLVRNNTTEKNQAIDKTEDSIQFQFDELPSALIGDYSVALASPIEGYTTTSSYDSATHTYTFVSTPKRYTINVVHNWVDFNNAYGLRPDSVTYTLDKTGGDSQNATSSNSWTASYPNLPELDKDLYSIQNVTVADYNTDTPGYNHDTNTYIFTSTLNTELITVIHRWENDSDVINSRPGDVSFNLVRNNTTEKNHQIDKSYRETLFQFELPSALINNYSVVLASPIEGYTTTSSYDSATHTYTFVSAPKRYTVNVVHNWIDSNNAYGYRPDSVTYTLDKTGGDSQTATSSSSWTASYPDLPELDKDLYSIQNVTIAEYDTPTPSYDADTNTYTFTSTLTHTFDIHINHVWVDNDNAYNRRPSSVSYALLKNSASVNTTSSNANWTAEFTDLPLLDEAQYSVATPIIQYYETGLESYDEATHTYTFKSTLSEKFTININHVWIDNDNANSLRPSSVTYELTKDNSQDSTTNSSANWTASFGNLPLLDENKYAVTTPSVEHYRTSASYDESTRTYTFTSTLSDQTGITVRQVWLDNNDARDLRPESLNYTLKKQGTNVDSLTLSGNSEDGFDDIDLLEIALYDVPEFEVEHYTVSREYNEATHTYTFTYTLIDDLDIHIVHIWDDNDNHFGLRPSSIEYQLTKAGSPNATATSNAEWTADFKNLRRPDEEQYAVSTPNVAEYDTTVSYDADTHTYTFTSTLKSTTINIKHIWDDNDDEIGSRPTSDLHFDLIYGNDIEDSKDLNSADTTVESSFSGLPTSKLDQFSVEMTEVDHYVTTVDYDEDTQTYTFISTPKPLAITVVNIWQDNNNADGKRPSSTELQLLLDDEQIDTIIFENEDNEENALIENLFEALRGGYDVVLPNTPEGYVTTVDFDESTMTFTFTHKYIPPTPSNSNTHDKIGQSIAILAAAVVLGLGTTVSLYRKKQA